MARKVEIDTRWLVVAVPLLVAITSGLASYGSAQLTNKTEVRRIVQEQTDALQKALLADTLQLRQELQSRTELVDKLWKAREELINRISALDLEVAQLRNERIDLQRQVTNLSAQVGMLKTENETLRKRLEEPEVG